MKKFIKYVKFITGINYFFTLNSLFWCKNHWPRLKTKLSMNSTAKNSMFYISRLVKTMVTQQTRK